MRSRIYCNGRPSVRPSVRLSVCPIRLPHTSAAGLLQDVGTYTVFTLYSRLYNRLYNALLRKRKEVTRPGKRKLTSIIRGFVDTDCNSVFSVTDCERVHTRGHNLSLYKQHCYNVNCRLNAFVCRNINVWNRLPAHVVNSDSVAVFKHKPLFISAPRTLISVV